MTARSVARTLMIQGTASSVGKSLLVAALCRIFHQDGVSVAPFKSQNMALNSYVTADGGEMGRAQVVQALAAGLAPRVEMNPILLKPEADHRSQVVVMGRSCGSMGFRDYRTQRATLLTVVGTALDTLRAEHDLVVIEGAGSPAEINLKAGEIVNMRIARLADAPVILTGDIDRGGVFAHLVGTLALLDDDERSRIKGFFINRFRGDVSLLKDGLDFLEQRTGVPVLGVIPFVPDLRIPEEDSVWLERLPASHAGSGSSAGINASMSASDLGYGDHPLIDVAVIRLPHVANFDDFDPLAAEPGVRVRYVSHPAELDGAALLILPGTKTTIADLRWMSTRGLTDRIRALALDGTPVLGICGGYQMLGRLVEDPHGAESDASDSESGLNLLPASTIFQQTKSTRQVQGTVLANRGILAGCGGLTISGYEIHMGRSTSDTGTGASAFVLEPVGSLAGRATASADGMLSASGTVLGTYLHGLFENAALRRVLLRNLAIARGMGDSPIVAEWGKLGTLDSELDRLAAAVRQSVDVARLYAIAGLNHP